MKTKIKEIPPSFTAADAKKMVKASLPRMKVRIVSDILWRIENAASEGRTKYEVFLYADEFQLIKDQIAPIFVNRGFKVSGASDDNFIQNKTASVTLTFSWR